MRAAVKFGIDGELVANLQSLLTKFRRILAVPLVKPGLALCCLPLRLFDPLLQELGYIEGTVRLSACSLYPLKDRTRQMQADRLLFRIRAANAPIQVHRFS